LTIEPASEEVRDALIVPELIGFGEVAVDSISALPTARVSIVRGDCPAGDWSHEEEKSDNGLAHSVLLVVEEWSRSGFELLAHAENETQPIAARACANVCGQAYLKHLMLEGSLETRLGFMRQRDGRPFKKGAGDAEWLGARCPRFPQLERNFEELLAPS
jgi:hypothetical protein